MRPVIGMIPARLGSSRLPEKMLASIRGKPLLQWTVDNALKYNKFSKFVIATDDERIATLARYCDCDVVMTPALCRSGTERLATALMQMTGVPDDAVVVNIQGDWPLLSPTTISAVVDLLQADGSREMASAAVPLLDAENLHHPSLVKCVMDRHGRALYFSRAPIPYPGSRSLSASLPPLPCFYGHLGIYSYRSDFLMRYPSLEASRLADLEQLEQLKALENGHTIWMAIVRDRPLGVDTADDLTKLEEHLCSQNIFSSQAAL